MDDAGDPNRQAPLDSLAMMSSDRKYLQKAWCVNTADRQKEPATDAPRSPALTSTNCESSDLTYHTELTSRQVDSDNRLKESSHKRVAEYIGVENRGFGGNRQNFARALPMMRICR